MKITIRQLRRLIHEALSLKYVDEESMGQGHEPSSSIYQMNHQGDGDHYDQMGNVMDEDEPDDEEVSDE